MSLSEILAGSVTAPPEFTEKSIYYAKRAIIDTFSAMVVGTTGETVNRLLPCYEKAGNCSLVGSDVKLSPRDAAFLNGISGHDYELDDTGISGQGHPSVVVLPAVLAQAEEQDVDGMTLIKAFLLAQEVENRIGRIIAWECHERGWHASGLEGALGASAGVSWLMGLDAKGVQNAIGIAASFASGLRENFGTMTKCVHIGKTNEDGLRAAYLAKAGIDSSPTALEGKEGFIFEHAGFMDEDGKFEEIVKGFGKDWDICEVGFDIKRYPSCSSTHRPMDSITELIDENDIKPEQVERIDVYMGLPAMRDLVTPDPKNAQEAKFSVGFLTGLYLHGIPITPFNMTEENIFRPEIQNIIKRTTMNINEEYNDVPDDQGLGPADVRIVLKDGREFFRSRVFAVGMMADPMSDEDLKKKFMTYCSIVLGEEKSAVLYDALCDLEHCGSVRELMKLASPEKH